MEAAGRVAVASREGSWETLARGHRISVVQDEVV